MSEKNIFGGMFDFNRDGITDTIERAIGYQALQEMEEENDRNTEERCPFRETDTEQFIDS